MLGGLVCAGTALASSVVALPITDQFRLSQHVVVGEVISQRTIDDAAFGVETQIELQVALSLKGGLTAGQSLSFFVRGGILDDQFYEAIGEAQFQTGRRALVFLEEIDGRLYVAGLSTGAWNLIEQEGQWSFTRALQGGLEIVGELEPGPLSLPQLQSLARRAASNPRFESAWLREATIGRQP
jgi:hypothetical protein